MNPNLTQYVTDTMDLFLQISHPGLQGKYSYSKEKKMIIFYFMKLNQHMLIGKKHLHSLQLEDIDYLQTEFITAYKHKVVKFTSNGV